jgi:hypothetical protein
MNKQDYLYYYETCEDDCCDDGCYGDDECDDCDDNCPFYPDDTDQEDDGPNGYED